MGNELKIRIALKDRIGKIIEKVFSEGIEKGADWHIAKKRGMWMCGLEVLKDYPELEEEKERRGGDRSKSQRGGRSVTFASVADELGRRNVVIKNWMDLVKAIGKKKQDFENYAIQERNSYIAAQKKFLSGKKVALLSGIGYEFFEGDPKIFEGDALEFLRADDAQYDLICLDPPYNMGDFEWDQLYSEEEYFGWCDEWIKLAFPRLKDTGSIYIFGIFLMLRKISLLLDDNGFIFRDCITWDHIQGTGGGLWVNRQEGILYYSKDEKVYQNKEAVTVEREKENIRKYRGKIYDYKNPSNVWYFPDLDEKSPERVSDITQKPVVILERILSGSCPLGGSAIDFFAGSGSFGIACMRKKVHCTLVEKLSENVALIKQRIAGEHQLQERNINENSNS